MRSPTFEATQNLSLLLVGLVAALLLILQAPLAGGRLLHVSLVFRHGHRAPIHPLPNDNYTVANTWRDGLGQLTNLGKRNQFELGKFLRARYGDFLGSRYNSSEHRIRSSDIDRTLMSAQACLAGLFPPAGDQVWQPGLNWQPIPVHTVSRSADPTLLPHAYDGCQQRFNRLIVEARRSSPDRRRLETEMAGFLQRLSTEAGSGKGQITLDNIYKVADTLMVLSAANLSLPSWALAPDTQSRLHQLGRFSWAESARTDELRRMRSGVLIDRLLADMEAAATAAAGGPTRQAHSGGRRLKIYSGHDVTLVPLLAALGSPDYSVWPNYAACLMFELHSTPGSGSETEVKIFYRNESRQRDPLPIPVPGCGDGRAACTLDRLGRALAGTRLSPGQFRSLCLREAGSHGGAADAVAVFSNANAVLVAVAVALPTAVLLVAAVHFCWLRGWLRRRQEESPPIAYHSLLGEVEN